MRESDEHEVFADISLFQKQTCERRSSCKNVQKEHSWFHVSYNSFFHCINSIKCVRSEYLKDDLQDPYELNGEV